MTSTKSPDELWPAMLSQLVASGIAALYTAGGMRSLRTVFVVGLTETLDAVAKLYGNNPAALEYSQRFLLGVREYAGDVPPDNKPTPARTLH